ncbi:Uncharacterized sugar kinase slr0537 [Chlamydiales bacterium SCGC AG-110-P3]|nr:Uncharacterized sugar kinase slr0537 [Chlamydiales bacterium SCGC AG-110-P3]
MIMFSTRLRILVVVLLGAMRLNGEESAQVVALGSVLMDHLVAVEDQFLSEHVGGEKGGRELVEAVRLKNLLDQVPGNAQMAPGGSAVNQLKGLARLGWRCKLIGNIGNDRIGNRCIDELDIHNIDSVLAKEPLPTGQVLCLVTPDHNRTMRTYIGAAGVTDNITIDAAELEGASILHIEGYQYANHRLVEMAADAAHQVGCLVSLDLASFEMVKEHKGFLEQFIPSHVDVLFSNADEASQLTGLGPEQAAAVLGRKVRVAVVTTGCEGCFVAADGRTVSCPSVPAIPVDTTGAGDLFSSGFLHGYLHGESLYQCGMYGNTIAARCIEQLGAYLSDASWEQVKVELGALGILVHQK